MMRVWFFSPVIQTISTAYKHIFCMRSLPGERVVICAKQKRQSWWEWRLVQFNLQNGRTVEDVKLPKRPEGMTSITLDGKSCVALSYV